MIFPPPIVTTHPGFYDAPMLNGFEDHFTNNKVIMTGTNVGSETCTGNGTTIMGHNSYFTPTGNLTECKVPLDTWQKMGHDAGSTVAKTPDDATIIGWAKEKLGIH